ncbi:MAG: hypothetical protein U0271_04140 [Polyangiaceae bacterium]
MADSGLLSTYSKGVVRLALPDPEAPGGAFRATLLAASLSLDEASVIWLFRALLPRLVAHEIGHALRDEAHATGPELWPEEQAADRLACLLSRPHLDAETRARAASILASTGLAGLGEALAGYRHKELAAAHPVFAAVTPTAMPAEAAYRDLPTFQRVSVAWAYLDLLLDPEDCLDDYRRDLLVAG